MTELKVKTKRAELLEIQAHLSAALKEVSHAEELASTMAACCESSLQYLGKEIERALAQTKHHLKVGFLKDDLIK